MILALNEGPTGPVSAIISFNAVIVSVAIWVITGIALSWLQMIGIGIAFAGIVIVSVIKPPKERESHSSSRKLQ